jgi:hypothetical protein
MVRYYGRAKQRVGSVNTPQLGLKMSGCPSKIGKSGSLVRYQSRRAQCNLKFMGPVRYHGVIWSINSGPNTVPKQSKCAANAGGVGRINAPRFECSRKNKIKEHEMKKYKVKPGFPIPINFSVIYLPGCTGITYEQWAKAGGNFTSWCASEICGATHEWCGFSGREANWCEAPTGWTKGKNTGKQPFCMSN